MPHMPEQRRGPDRRRLPRGGRRATDRDGFAPLVLLVDDTGTGTRCEAILAKLHFAVAPARSLDEAQRIMAALHPDLIVSRPADAAQLRSTAPQHVPVVTSDQDTDPDALIEEIRRALRAKRPPPERG